MIVDKLKEILYKRNMSKNKIFISCGNKTRKLSLFKIHLVNPIRRIYLNIGDNCIVKGNFFFESKEGYISIGNNCYIGNSNFISRSKITIGDNVTIAWGCTIYDHDSHSLDYKERRKDVLDEIKCIENGENFIASKNWDCVNSKPIVIHDDVWIGMNCTILKGVVIGEGAVIGACSVVTKDVPAWSVVAGNPAKVVKTLNQLA